MILINFYRGDAEAVFRQMSKKVKIEKICFDQDCEPIWLERDNAVKNFCVSHKVQLTKLSILLFYFYFE